MVHLVCLFMKTHLVALLQDNCLHLLRCTFLRKLSACVRNITASCQHLQYVGRFGRYRHIGETQISARYVGLYLFLTKAFFHNRDDLFHGLKSEIKRNQPHFIGFSVRKCKIQWSIWRCCSLLVPSRVKLLYTLEVYVKCTFAELWHC